MSRIIIALGVFIGFSLLQCSENQADPVTLNEEFRVAEAELITLQLDEDPGYINVQVLDIADSRCPSDAVCVRAGEAVVKIGVTGLEEVLKTLDLCIGDCNPAILGASINDTVSVEIDDKNYAVILVDVVPYPTTTNGNNTKEAILKIIAG